MTSRTISRLAALITAALVALAAAAPAAARAGTAAAKDSPAPAVAQKDPPAKGKAPAAPPVDPNTIEKEFTVMLVNGTKLKAVVHPSADWPGKTVKLDTPVMKNDINVQVVAQKSMWEIWGPQTGSFRVEDAKLGQRDFAGAIVIYPLRSGKKLCVYPLVDEAGKLMTGIKLWLE